MEADNDGMLVRQYYEDSKEIKIRKDAPSEYCIQKKMLDPRRTNEFIIPCNSIYASRKHCEISRKNKAYWIKDCNSSNGTFLNGYRIQSERELRFGDLIGIGVSHKEDLANGMNKSDYFIYLFTKFECAVVDLSDSESDIICITDDEEVSEDKDEVIDIVITTVTGASLPPSLSSESEPQIILPSPDLPDFIANEVTREDSSRDQTKIIEIDTSSNKSNRIQAPIPSTSNSKPKTEPPSPPTSQSSSSVQSKDAHEKSTKTDTTKPTSTDNDKPAIASTSSSSKRKCPPPPPPILSRPPHPTQNVVNANEPTATQQQKSREMMNSEVLKKSEPPIIIIPPQSSSSPVIPPPQIHNSSKLKGFDSSKKPVKLNENNVNKATSQSLTLPQSLSSTSKSDSKNVVQVHETVKADSNANAVTINDSNSEDSNKKSSTTSKAEHLLKHRAKQSVQNSARNISSGSGEHDHANIYGGKEYISSDSDSDCGSDENDLIEETQIPAKKFRSSTDSCRSTGAPAPVAHSSSKKRRTLVENNGSNSSSNEDSNNENDDDEDNDVSNDDVGSSVDSDSEPEPVVSSPLRYSSEENESNEEAEMECGLNDQNSGSKSDVMSSAQLPTKARLPSTSSSAAAALILSRKSSTSGPGQKMAIFIDADQMPTPRAARRAQKKYGTCTSSETAPAPPVVPRTRRRRSATVKTTPRNTPTPSKLKPMTKEERKKFRKEQLRKLSLKALKQRMLQPKQTKTRHVVKAKMTERNRNEGLIEDIDKSQNRKA